MLNNRKYIKSIDKKTPLRNNFIRRGILFYFSSSLKYGLYSILYLLLGKNFL